MTIKLLSSGISQPAVLVQILQEYKMTEVSLFLSLFHSLSSAPRPTLSRILFGRKAQGENKSATNHRSYFSCIFGGTLACLRFRKLTQSFSNSTATLSRDSHLISRAHHYHSALVCTDNRSDSAITKKTGQNVQIKSHYLGLRPRE